MVAHRLEHADRGERDLLGGARRAIRGGGHEAHAGEVVDLVGPLLLDEAIPALLRDVGATAEPHAAAQRGQHRGLVARHVAHGADDLVALREQELGEVRAVLSGYAGDERALRHRAGVYPSAGRDATALVRRPRGVAAAPDVLLDVTRLDTAASERGAGGSRRSPRRDQLASSYFAPSSLAFRCEAPASLASTKNGVTEVGLVEVRAVEVGTAEVRVAELRCARVDAPKGRTGQVRARGLDAVELGVVDDSAAQVRASQLGGAEVGAGQVAARGVEALERGATQICADEGRAGRRRAREPRALERRVVEAGAVEPRALEPSTRRVRDLERRADERRTIERRVGEARAVEHGAGRGGVVERRLRERRVDEARARDRRAREVCLVERRTQEVGAVPGAAREPRARRHERACVRRLAARAGEVRADERRPVEARAAQVRAAEVRARRVGAREVGLGEVRRSELRARELRPRQVRAAQDDAAELHLAEVLVAQVDAAEVRAGEVEIPHVTLVLPPERDRGAQIALDDRPWVRRQLDGREVDLRGRLRRLHVALVGLRLGRGEDPDGARRGRRRLPEGRHAEAHLRSIEIRGPRRDTRRRARHLRQAGGPLVAGERQHLRRRPRERLHDGRRRFVAHIGRGLGERQRGRRQDRSQ